MNTEQSQVTETGEKQKAFHAIMEINNLVKGSGRIEQIYLTIDRTVILAKEIYSESYCVSCPITCCINDLYLPITFLEWKSIETYLDKKTTEDTKNKIRENLGKIPNEFFNAIYLEKSALDNYKDKSCPLLINNKCSIRPYRPVSCRTYGLFLKEGSFEENYTLVDACNPELSRLENEKKHAKVYLPTITEIKGTLSHLNRNKPTKLLIVWLKEYLSPFREK